MKSLRLEDAVPQSGSRHRKLRVGRGHSAGQGKTSGRGMRGQKCRSGGGVRPGFEGGQIPLYMRLPKLKGFELVNPSSYTIVNLKQLRDLPADSAVNIESLLDAGILTATSGPLRVLGDGEAHVALQVTAAYFTASAREKIEAAGGTCTVEA
ncbi:MAG: 50S ribosomal protein L15 [Aphanocapsa lilacina HA4352-LM1]|jgi:large subunit ribosomal protein L15|uniref:Large ribosomal subunit protein uL15 n=1 Tax=Gloeobacter morelensis MG652769 TaxID=2781736 RepID=A0ABY3PIU6_9CYAN|nr:50S ribosomal protein L15 [Gloeobacter morelensis]MBW4696978.1 50S ribosomal protein L15 [Aphanocapsa lilacina HA4352-LM1]UFP93519.1 50S ribosomal protein L15 [Gloeobacter morelensis MG652769]